MGSEPGMLRLYFVNDFVKTKLDNCTRILNRLVCEKFFKLKKRKELSGEN
jgi:hypothetical protein